MDKEILKTIIFDQHEVIKNANIVERDIKLDENFNYVLVGLRRAGKSWLLYKRVKDLIKRGINWNQIIYINFDDERLSTFTIKDFEDIIIAAKEITNKPKYYYFDEIQNIDGWEKFARRLADQKEKVDITGSNAKMLSSEISAKLGGRYIAKEIYPYSFDEFLRAKLFNCQDLSSTNNALLNQLTYEYLNFGGLPESVKLKLKREYISSVFDKVFLNDIVVHNQVRKPNEIKCMIHKIAETVKTDISYSRLHKCVQNVGFKLSKDNIIDYSKYCIDSFLIFKVNNYYDSFVEKETTPKYYFIDNGILNLFLHEKNTTLLENVVACHLHSKFTNHLFFTKSVPEKFEIDFLIPKIKVAIQTCWKLDENSTDREIESIIKFTKFSKKTKYKYFIVTYDQEKVIKKDGVTINIVPLSKFLLGKVL